MAPRSRGPYKRSLGDNHEDRNRCEGKQRTTTRKTAESEVCRNYQKTGSCTYGSKCKFSHHPLPKIDSKPSRNDTSTKSDQTPEQERARLNYQSWKRVIKTKPLSNSQTSKEQFWSDALIILEGSERDWKQMVPRDLDSEEYFGRDHIEALLNTRAEYKDEVAFIQLVQPFLEVMTHPSILDCLSVDTAVGGLYNFISGTNGTRAIPFLEHVCRVLGQLSLNQPSSLQPTIINTTTIAVSTLLCELLRREARARFNDNLPALINNIENVVEINTSEAQSQVRILVLNHLGQVRAMMMRAKGLLAQEENQHKDSLPGASTSSYPRILVLPGNRHDNDKMDITKIEIFPSYEEIMSNEEEFLPSTNLEQPHFLTDQAERHVDTCFRLLRHDSFGELKNVLGGLIHALRQDPNTRRLNFGDFRAHSYLDAHISHISSDRRRGLGINISFPQPSAIRKKSNPERAKWWEESKRFAEGSLLSFISAQQGKVSHVFFTVMDKNPETKDDLITKNAQATITAKLVSYNQSSIESVIRLSCQNARGTLIEFPGILPVTFISILANLQDMQRQSRMPLRQCFLPDAIGKVDELKKMNIAPPLYSRKPDFAFPLSPILKPGERNDASFCIRPNTTVDDLVILKEMESRTHLDLGQCQALIAALTREVALIQGPPGTGKSYLGVQLMKVLMQLKKSVDLGPVVVVCYTNHALDQFLEHLLETGIDKVIRIGGQSQSVLLENHNLRKISQTETRTKHDKYLLATRYESLEEQSASIRRDLGKAHNILKSQAWSNLQYHLSRNHPRIHAQFRKVDKEGFEVLGRHPFDTWASSGKPSNMSVDRNKPNQMIDNIEIILGKAAKNVNSLSQVERSALMKLWSQEVHGHAIDTVSEGVKETNRIQAEITNIHDEIDRRVLQNADVIGITTTGLATRTSTLQRVRCKIVICEEAGEVMEPHMLCALLPTIEHFIQIGDHEQLRPQINNYSLSLESSQGALHQLDRSQFERLSLGEPGRLRMPLAQLNVQRRMRPEISMLIRETIYPKLNDHCSVSDLPDVIGMRRNIYWLDHNRFEETQHSEMHHKSHSNLWEVQMVHALVRHIVRQGTYSSKDIAVLTPYTGQLQKLRSAMRNDFEIVLSDRDQTALENDGFGSETVSEDAGAITHYDQRNKPLEKKKLSELLRVATVDNFQGEEAKVIIVSLVRSNEKRKVGFLRTTNRINVLLSRAQHGMYLIGNADTYEHIPMWQKVLNLLRATDSVGNTLGLCCPRHKDTSIEVSEPEDFPRLSPEGGCQLACPWRLPGCGHMCQARCHSQSLHDIFLCPQRCQRVHEPCKHLCQKPTCGEDCGRCCVKLNGVQLPCGHSKDDIFCHLSQKPNSIYCSYLVQKTVPECNHLVGVECSLDVASDTYRCPTPCQTILSCGHVCPGTCGKCNTAIDNDQISTCHQVCRKICGKRFATCSHTCRKTCHDGEDCGPCLSPCEVRCQHSKCPSRCNETCAPCIETCTWSCEHKGSCSMPCSAPCNRLPCDQRCLKELPCGHQCPGLCGETCRPDYCFHCAMKQDARVDLLEMKVYADIDIDETPIVVLGCGHFFTAESLDGVVGLSDVYITDPLGDFSGLADLSSTLASKIPQCPDCQSPIRQYFTQRYNRVINRAVFDEMSKRFLVNGKAELRRLEVQVDSLEQALEETRSNVTLALSTNQTSTAPKKAVPKSDRARHDMISKLNKDIMLFLQRVADEHQPARKLQNAILYTARTQQKDSLDKDLASLSLSEAIPSVLHDHRVTLGGRMMQIKMECIVLEDKFSILGIAKSAGSSTEAIKLPGGPPQILTPAFLKKCSKFIEDCTTGNIPKLAAEASLYFARLARLYQSCGLLDESARKKASQYVNEARELLHKALELCEQPFQNAQQLKLAIEKTIMLLRREWYEPVSKEELVTIKQAMVSGPGGIATHSGHWYNCVNGHPFAIGEYGMPMEQARCPECGSPVGGRNHQAVTGVTRAMEMET